MFEQKDSLNWTNPNPHDLRYWHYLWCAYSDRGSFVDFVFGKCFYDGVISHKSIDAFELLAVKFLTSAINISKLSDTSIYKYDADTCINDWSIIKPLTYTYNDICNYCNYNFLSVSSQYLRDDDLVLLIKALKKGLDKARYFPVKLYTTPTDSGRQNYSGSSSVSWDEAAINATFTFATNTNKAYYKYVYTVINEDTVSHVISGCDGFNVYFYGQNRSAKYKKYVFTTQLNYFDLLHTGQALNKADWFTQARLDPNASIQTFLHLEDIVTSSNTIQYYTYTHEDFSIKSFPLMGDLDGVTTKTQACYVFPAVLIDIDGYTIY